MLVLTRRKGQRIEIGPHITVHVIAVEGGLVRIGIEAPPEVSILRDDAKVREPRK